ncbi:hypothetical protein IQ07DRAFT_416936 [Pyrenochaeta sp. DS3sAY3a]|nr:hypothetical protein IQ07DRAFT_416936 [Pyrenochaeta sp. DS3sAY3a]
MIISTRSSKIRKSSYYGYSVRSVQKRRLKTKAEASKHFLLGSTSSPISTSFAQFPMNLMEGQTPFQPRRQSITKHQSLHRRHLFQIRMTRIKTPHHDSTSLWAFPISTIHGFHATLSLEKLADQAASFQSTRATCSYSKARTWTLSQLMLKVRLAPTRAIGKYYGSTAN